VKAFAEAAFGHANTFEVLVKSKTGLLISSTLGYNGGSNSYNFEMWLPKADEYCAFLLLLGCKNKKQTTQKTQN